MSPGLWMWWMEWGMAHRTIDPYLIVKGRLSDAATIVDDGLPGWWPSWRFSQAYSLATKDWWNSWLWDRDLNIP